jgi:cytochrome c6
MLSLVVAVSISLLTSCTDSEQTAGVGAGGEAKKEAVSEQAKEQSAGSLASGEALFKKHCAACHPNGGNIITPEKTLRKDAREARNIKAPEDIIAKMRNPGPGMNMFDKTTIPDNEARAIAEYILKTY